MLVKGVRFDWLNVFKRDNNGKFSVCCLVPKSNKALVASIRAEIAAGIAKGIKDGKFTEAQTKSDKFKGCLQDGDKAVECEEREDYYKGHYFFNANSNDPVGIGEFRDGNVVECENDGSFYSGCYGAVDCNFFPFNTKQIGIGAGLNNILKTRDGDRLDGRQNVHQAFANFEDEDAGME